MSFWPRGLNLRQRLALLLLVASVPGMIVAIVLAINALRDQSRQIETTARYLANLQAAQHGSVMESARIMLDTLIASGALHGPDAPECNGLTSDWMARYPSFTSLMLFDAQGGVRCAVDAAEAPVDPAERPWFDQVRRAKEFAVGTWTLGPAGTPLVIAGLPILDAGGDFAGAVAVTIDLRWLEFLARRVDLPRGTTVTALAADGSILSHHVVPAPEEGEEGAASFPAFELRETMVALRQGTLRGPSQGGDPRTYGFHTTDVGGLVVAVGMSPYLTFTRYGAALRDTLTAPLAILILALIAAWWGADKLITRWVRSLTRTTREMAAGDLGVRSEVPHSRYEIGELAAAFDGMADNIQERDRDLRAALTERETLLQELHHRVKNNMQMVISLINLHSRHIANDALRLRLDDIRKRIQALATIHDLLYQRDRRVQSPSLDYAQRLCASLSQLYRSDGGIEVELAVEPVRLSTDQAIPFGLTVSELVSNAHKHAFPDGRTGRIRIVVEAERGAAGEEIGHLVVEDDGIGPPEGRDPLDVMSTGLQVVTALAGQLNGTLSFERRDDWSRVHLRFPLAAAGAA